MIVYKATNKIDGKSYIGQTVRDLKQRKQEHISRIRGQRTHSYFSKAIRKYGIGNFTWEILQKCDTIEELNRLEIYYIGLYDTFENGYNLTLGGKGHLGHKDSKETKIKKSKAARKRVYTDWDRKRMSEGHNPNQIKGNNPHAKSIILIHPSGEKEFFEYIKGAVNKYNLNSGNLSGRNHSKGYKIRRI